MGHAGEQPDAVHAIETARDLGWLDAGYNDREFATLNALVANVFSGGSIDTNVYNTKSVLNNQGYRSHVLDALEGAGLEYPIVKAESDTEAVVRPKEHTSLLGRVLSTFGAPVGPKAEIHDLELQWYLGDAPADVRELFVLAYVANEKPRENGGRYGFAVYRKRGRGCQVLKTKAVKASNLPLLRWHGGGDHRGTRQAKLAIADVF